MIRQFLISLKLFELTQQALKPSIKGRLLLGKSVSLTKLLVIIQSCLKGIQIILEYLIIAE